jgi:hypothetical protein
VVVEVLLLLLLLLLVIVVLRIIIIIIRDSAILTERFKETFGIHTRKLDSLQKTAILRTSHLKL